MGKIDFESHIDLKFALQALANLSRGYVFPFPTGKGRVVDEKVERDRRRIDGDCRERFRALLGRHRFADINVGETCDHHDVARLCFICLYTFKPVEGKKLGYFAAVRFAMPCLPIAYITGKSACSLEAPSSRNSSSTCSSARTGSAAGLSILLITTMGLRPSSSDFLRTKRVCGMGPSCASTTRRTESIERNTRSTSEPKSACPGVSTMLIFVLARPEPVEGYMTAAFLE